MRNIPTRAAAKGTVFEADKSRSEDRFLSMAKRNFFKNLKKVSIYY